MSIAILTACMCQFSMMAYRSTAHAYRDEFLGVSAPDWRLTTAVAQGNACGP